MVQMMADDRFWALMAASRFPRNQEKQVSALRPRLEVLSLEDVEAFEAAFRDKLDRSYSFDLWGAAYLANGGCSDDGFHYFRCWLVSSGREVFENALADPDSLADVRKPLWDDWEF